VQLERCFIDWTAAVARHSGGTLVAIDGKTIRRSFDHANKKSAVHMVSVFAHANRLVLGQLAVDDGSGGSGSGGKSNEITALPRLLELLDLKGKTVTVDAMHCLSRTSRCQTMLTYSTKISRAHRI